PEECEAGVVALKSRSIAAADAVTLSLEAFEWLRAQGCRQYVFKYCSTFDSTPQGNIGPVGEALAEALKVKGVVACPAFPTTGCTVYQGHLFVGGRLLNESGLENHPLNPMTDPDIRRWLALQCAGPIGLAPWPVVRQGSAALRGALAAAAERGETLAIVDAISDDDLLAIGEACAEAPLLTGGSGIALGLPRNFVRQGLAQGAGSAFVGNDGPEAVLAGSCSGATLAQIEVHRRDHPVLQIEVEAVIEGAATPEALAAFVHDHEGEGPLVFSSAATDKVRALQEAYGREVIAAKLDALFAETARRLVYDGVSRLVVAGGETSGAVVTALNLEAVAIGPEIDPGVPALAATDGRTLALALKSGNFGGPDFFAKALRMLGANA
ncbi:MAG: Uncharacterized protein YgbK, partial [uncultured Microvirga sp.]